MLVITNWRDLDHPEAGGAEVVCQELARRLAAAGEDVVLLCAAVDGAPSQELRDNYRIIRAGGKFTVYARALCWLLLHRHLVTGVIDSQNGIPFFTPLAVRRNTAAVMLLHHIHQEQFAKYFPAPMALVGRWLESTASRIVYGRRAILAVSPSTRTGARQVLGLRGSVWVAPPGWSVTEDVRRMPIERTQHPSIVCVGRLVPHKRTELIISAFPAVLSRHPDATLTIVGRGPEEPRLRSLAASSGAGESIIFRSDLDDAQRDRMMSTAWLTVNASQGEGWGLSVVEANALGVPALAFRRPGLCDSIVNGETGWLIEDDDDLGEAIAACLTELSDLGRSRQLAQHARQWAGRFTWAAMTDRVTAALAAETARLSRGAPDRRTASDLATVVTLPAHALPANWQSRVRKSDLWTQTDDTVTMLCRGADTQTVAALLRRLGLDDADRARVGISVARTSDLLRLPSPTVMSNG